MSADRIGRLGMILASMVMAALALAAPVLAGSFRLPGLRGGELTSEQTASGSTVMVIWASWSPRCRDIGEQSNALLERWGGKARVVTVNFQEEKDAAQAFVSRQGMRAPTYLDLDGEFAKAFGVTALPGLLVLRDGKAVFSGRLTSEADGILAELLP